MKTSGNWWDGCPSITLSDISMLRGYTEKEFSEVFTKGPAELLNIIINNGCIGVHEGCEMIRNYRKTGKWVLVRDPHKKKREAPAVEKPTESVRLLNEINDKFDRLLKYLEGSTKVAVDPEWQHHNKLFNSDNPMELEAQHSAIMGDILVAPKVTS